MIINNKKRKIYFLLAVPLAVLVAYVFSCVADLAYKTNAFGNGIFPMWLPPVIEFICGMFFMVGIGMMLNEDSRINGVIYAVIFIAAPLMMYFSNLVGRVYLLNIMYPAGLLIGALIVVKTVFSNRYDKLASVSKVLLTVLMLLLSGFLAYVMVATSTAAAADAGSAFAAQNIFVFGAGIVVVLLLYYIAIKITVGVRASEIFIFGPRSSGKTYFVLGLWSYISEHFDKGHSNEGVVLTGDPNDEGDDLRISSLYADIMDGKILSRTFRYQMVMYQLSGKKWGILPVKWTVVDYAGEYYDELNEVNFRRAVEIISRNTGISKSDIKKDAGTIDFVKFIKLHHSDKLLDPEFTKSVILSTMYGNFLRAGKVIFLVDGEKITDNRKGHAQLAKEFGGYMKTLIDLESRNVLNFFKETKKYALVVTKADLVFWKNSDIKGLIQSMHASKLSDIPEKSRNAVEIEKRLYEILNMNMVFRNLVNIMNDISMYFIAVSVDASSEPFPTEEGLEEEISPSTLAPWRFTEIFRFGL